MGHPRRRVRPRLRRAAIGRPLGATAVLLAALAAAGCTSASAGATVAGRPAVTPAQARQVWARYAAVSGAEAVRPGDPALAFYLPEESGYPRFFVAAVTRELMLFERARAAAPWLLASIADLAAGEALPALATDSAGYVPTMPPSAATLLAQPDEVGALQAGVVDDGPASAAARAVADGQFTSGLYQVACAHAQGITAPPGDVYQWDLEGTSHPEFALRTADGGALVFYVMALDTTVAVPGYIDEADPVRSGPPIQMTAGVRRLLPAGQPTPLIDIQTEQVLSFAAIDPPAPVGKIRVIAMGGGLTSVTAS